MQTLRVEQPQQGPDTVYILAAVAVPREQTDWRPAESDLRAALGQGQGNVIFIANDAEKFNSALVQLRPEPEPVAEPLMDEDEPNLTPRETEVMHLVAKGLRTNEIADVLLLSGHTVNTHLRHVFRKLGVSNRSEAVFEAMRRRIIEPC